MAEFASCLFCAEQIQQSKFSAHMTKHRREFGRSADASCEYDTIKGYTPLGKARVLGRFIKYGSGRLRPELAMMKNRVDVARRNYGVAIDNAEHQNGHLGRVLLAVNEADAAYNSVGVWRWGHSPSLQRTYDQLKCDVRSYVASEPM